MKELEQDPREVILSDIMYSIGMESREAYFHMEMLCHELKIPFPPKRIEPVMASCKPIDCSNGLD